MEEVWYRQYFWLLLFAGIILFTGIFSLITVCICLKKNSKRVSLQNQQSFKQKRREDQHEHPVTFIQNTSHESFLPKMLPEQETEPVTHNATEKTEDTNSESHYYVESMTDHEYIVFDDGETNTEHLQYDYVLPDVSSDDDYDDVVIPHEYMKRE